MTAPTRIVYAARNTYALDPYVRDAAGRFAPRPASPPPPIQLIEDQDRAAAPHLIDLSNGNRAAFTTGPDAGAYWKVRIIRDPDGTCRVHCYQP